MAKNQPVWALDIGQAALKALKLVPGETPDQVIAEAFDYIEYPKIRSQPDADPEELVREAMATLLERNDLKGCRVAVGVPGQAGLVKFIKLPPVEKKRIPDIVKFEARQQIPFALEEVIWDWQEIGGEDSDDDFAQTEVGLFAMKREQIYQAIQPFTAAGIEVDLVQMGPIALYNYIAFDRLRPTSDPESGEKASAPLEPGASVVVLDIGADHTDLIITDGQRIWQRNVPIGGNHFTRGLTKELKLTFAKAEHLKRNATKAPDPRAVFTAMRNNFNDFASEINRSIGFYSSVNRQAKVAKVIGLGNGFKLPGLQKFLQQNLSQDVEKLERFDRLVGDDVVKAPQFEENLPSFAVAYGLGLQGLGLGNLRTSLLPGEITQKRLIRAKKPWVLAAAAMLMLGFSSLFLGQYRVLAKVDNSAFDEAVKVATSAAKVGSDYESSYTAAVGEFTGWKTKGEKLITPAEEGASFGALFRNVSGTIYEPGRDPEFKDLNYDNPADRPKLDTLRVHIDGIRPVFKTDLAAWFNGPELRPSVKATMHPYDRETAPPASEGWVIEITGHHYNPLVKTDRKSGPYGFLVDRVVPKFWEVPVRQLGFSHACLAWMFSDATWTSQKGLANNGIPAAAPTLAHSAGATDAAAAGGAGGSMGDQMKMMAGAGGMGGSSGGMGGGSGGMGMPGVLARPGAGGGRGGMEEMMMGMGGMQGSRTSAYGVNAKNAPEMTYLTRTDFVIYVVWQPPTKEKPVMELGEMITKIREAEAKSKNQVTTPNIAEFEKESEAASAKVLAQEVGGDVPGGAPVATPLPGAAAAAGAPASPPANP